MDNLERKFGRYAIRNLTMVMIIMYAIGFMIAYLKPSLLYMVTLNPYAIMHGQIWRLVSWLLVLPGYSSVFSMAIMLFCYYSIGNALERIWGTWKYNVFILRGMLLMVVLVATGIVGRRLSSAVSAVYSNVLYPVAVAVNRLTVNLFYR